MHNQYEGGFVDDQQEGQGVFTKKTGEVYEGEFVKDKRHGVGAVTSPSGSSYQGEFKNDKKHGKGIHKYANGSTFSGFWREGRIHSLRGKHTFQNGRVEWQRWDEGKFIERLETGDLAELEHPE